MNSTNRSLNVSSIPGPQDIKRKVLTNGVTLLARSNFNSASVVVSGYLGGGSLLDPLDKLGLAHFTSLALMRGTQKRNFQQLFNELESVGASLGFGASVLHRHFSSISRDGFDIHYLTESQFPAPPTPH